MANEAPRESSSEPQATALVFCGVRRGSPAYDLIPIWNQEELPPIRLIQTFDQITESIQAAPTAVVLLTLMDMVALRELLPILTQIKPRMVDKTVSIVVLNFVDHPKVPRMLASTGCSEVLDPGTKPKALRLKLVRYLSRVEIALKRKQQAGNTKATRLSVNRAAQDLIANQNRVLEVEPLQTESDCWISASQAIKKVRQNWILSVMGPGPSVGKWVKSQQKSDTVGRESYWVWTPREPQGDPFVQGGQWRFFGIEPSFSELKWSFISSQPRLIFNSGTPRSPDFGKFQINSSGVLELAKNSSFALDKVPMIRASFEYSSDLSQKKSSGESFLKFFEKTKAKFLSTQRGDFERIQEELEDVANETQLDLEDLEQTAKEVLPDAQAPFLREFGSKSAISSLRIELYEGAEKKLKPREKLFAAVNSPQPRDSLLDEVEGIENQVILWTEKQKIRKETRVSSQDSGTGHIVVRYPSEFSSSDSFRDAIGQVDGDRLFLNINLNRTSLFFAENRDQVELGPMGIVLSRPEELFEVQRRTHFRFKFSPEREFGVQLAFDASGQWTSYLAIDLSSGGLCLEGSPADTTKLTRGAIVPRVCFDIYGKSIQCSAHVCWQKTLPSGKVRVGLEFVSLDPYDFQGIRLFIMEESFEYLDRFVGA